MSPLKHWAHLLPFLHLSLDSWLAIQTCDLFRHESGHLCERLQVSVGLEMDTLSTCLADVDHVAQSLFDCLKPHVGDLKWVSELEVVKLAPWAGRNDMVGEL